MISLPGLSSGAIRSSTGLSYRRGFALDEGIVGHDAHGPEHRPCLTAVAIRLRPRALTRKKLRWAGRPCASINKH